MNAAKKRQNFILKTNSGQAKDREQSGKKPVVAMKLPSVGKSKVTSISMGVQTQKQEEEMKSPQLTDEMVKSHQLYLELCREFNYYFTRCNKLSK